MKIDIKDIKPYEFDLSAGKMNPDDPNVGTGMGGAPACGDVMKLQIEVVDDIIKDAKFKTFGCKNDDDLVYNYSVNIDGYNFSEPRFYFSRIWPDRESKIQDQKMILNFKVRGSHNVNQFSKITDEKWGFELLPK